MPVTDMPPANGQQLPQIDPRLLELLVCPLTKTTLAYDAARQELISRAARLAFPIIDGMPILVITEARQLEDGDPVLRRP
jgi:uncharacterized protein